MRTGTQNTPSVSRESISFEPAYESISESKHRSNPYHVLNPHRYKRGWSSSRRPNRSESFCLSSACIPLSYDAASHHKSTRPRFALQCCALNWGVSNTPASWFSFISNWRLDFVDISISSSIILKYSWSNPDRWFVMNAEIFAMKTTSYLIYEDHFNHE